MPRVSAYRLTLPELKCLLLELFRQDPVSCCCTYQNIMIPPPYPPNTLHTFHVFPTDTPTLTSNHFSHSKRILCTRKPWYPTAPKGGWWRQLLSIWRRLPQPWGSICLTWELIHQLQPMTLSVWPCFSARCFARQRRWMGTPSYEEGDSASHMTLSPPIKGPPIPTIDLPLTLS